MTNSKIDITSFSKRGFGVGIIPDSFSTVEIAHTVVGDQVEALVKRKKRKGKLLQVLKASKDRVTPHCAHATICGGCSWQQMDYNAQLRYKEKVVLDTFSDLIQASNVDFFPILPCDDFWEYRNKMEFTFSENAAGTKFLGLMIAQASFYVFNLTKCHLVSGWMAKFLCEVRSWWESGDIQAFDCQKNEGVLKNLILKYSFSTKEKMIILNVFSIEDSLRESFLHLVKQTFQDEKISVYLKEEHTKKGTPTKISTEHLFGQKWITESQTIHEKTYYFKISPLSFFQTNPKQSQKLFEKAIEFVDFSDVKVAYDLYCGTATIAIAFSSYVESIIAIEINSQAVADAKENIDLNQIKNIKVFEGDVAEVLSSQDLPKPDLVIVDPPRAGLGEKALENICRLHPKKILYISCNPTTQAEDIRYLIKQSYKLKKIKPVDQFPHTYHIENIAYLEQ